MYPCESHVLNESAHFSHFLLVSSRSFVFVPVCRAFGVINSRKFCTLGIYFESLQIELRFGRDSSTHGNNRIIVSNGVRIQIRISMSTIFARRCTLFLRTFISMFVCSLVHTSLCHHVPLPTWQPARPLRQHPPPLPGPPHLPPHPQRGHLHGGLARVWGMEWAKGLDPPPSHLLHIDMHTPHKASALRKKGWAT